MKKEKIISRLRVKLDEMHIPYGDIDCYDGPTTVTVKVQFDGGDPVGNTLAGVEEEFDTFKDAFGIDKVAFGKDKTRSYADKNHIYIEIPKERKNRHYPKFVESENSCDWKEEKELPIFLGYDTFGKPLTLDLAESPNILAAGAYNQGGGVLLKSMLNSLLTAKNPGELRIMIADSELVDFSEYGNLDRSWFYGNGIITQDNPTGQLEHLCREMDERFSKLREAGCNNIVAYHRTHGGLPYIVVIVNEYPNYINYSYSTLNMAFLNAVIRLAQRGRTVGIHCIISTRRPSTENNPFIKNIPGSLMTNFPVKIATKCHSVTDSRIILDGQPGAERLLGMGDMLLLKDNKLTRLQGLYVGYEDTEALVDKLNSKLSEVNPISEMERIHYPSSTDILEGKFPLDDDTKNAARFVVSHGFTSTSDLQRHLGMGYAKASRIMDTIERLGIVGPSTASGRTLLVHDLDELEKILDNRDQ